MEAAVASRARPSALLLEHAFGRRMVEGKDEWRGVDSVVRSSFLLLYREFRRQDKRLRILEANQITPPRRHQTTQDDQSVLLHKQLQLLKEELQLVKSELSELRSTSASCKCQHDDPKSSLGQQIVMTQVAVQAQRQWHRHQKLRLKVSKIQRQVRGMRRVQHECEEIVVRTAEKHQRQVQGLFKKICGEVHKRERLEEEVEARVKPRIKLLEKHVVGMHRKLKLVGRPPVHSPNHGQEAGVVDSNREDIMGGSVKALARLKSTSRDAATICSKNRTSEPSRVELNRRSQLDSAKPESAKPDIGEEGEDELLSELAPIPNRNGHATLRLRYQHERKRQIRRLDRLRHTQLLPRPSSGT